MHRMQHRCTVNFHIIEYHTRSPPPRPIHVPSPIRKISSYTILGGHVGSLDPLQTIPVTSLPNEKSCRGLKISMFITQIYAKTSKYTPRIHERGCIIYFNSCFISSDMYYHFHIFTCVLTKHWVILLHSAPKSHFHPLTKAPSFTICIAFSFRRVVLD